MWLKESEPVSKTKEESGIGNKKGRERGRVSKGQDKGEDRSGEK